MPRSNTLLLIGLGLNVVGTATIFMFAYPPQDERRHRLFLTLTRMALILMFCGFLLQVLATWRRGNVLTRNRGAWPAVSRGQQMCRALLPQTGQQHASDGSCGSVAPLWAARPTQNGLSIAEFCFQRAQSPANSTKVDRKDAQI